MHVEGELSLRSSSEIGGARQVRRRVGGGAAETGRAGLASRHAILCCFPRFQTVNTTKCERTSPCYVPAHKWKPALMEWYDDRPRVSL